MLKINIFIFIFLITCISFPVKASNLCSNKAPKIDEFYKNPRHIEIAVKKFRKWNIKAIKLLIDKNERIEKKYKKNFKAEIKVHYENNICVHKAKIRITGDYKDHIFKKNTTIITSLKIKLLESNINGAVSFKLFNPISRHSENEVFFTSLLRASNYIAPKTSFVDVTFNGEKVRMLFQEDIRKELLEGMGRIEGPIFEGDETLLKDIFDNGYLPNCEKLSCLSGLVLTKLKNKNFFLKNNISMSISLDAHNKAQEIYRDLNATGRNTFLNYDLLSEDNLIKRKLRIFDIILISAGATHSLLARENKTLYWDALNTTFEPIYYDGNVEPAYYNLFRFMNEHDLSFIYKNFSKTDIGQAIDLLNQRNNLFFFKKLSDLGLNEIEIKNSKKLMEMTILNLKDFKLRIEKNKKQKKIKTVISDDKKNIDNYIEDKKNLLPNMPHIFVSKPNNSRLSILKCLNKLCNEKTIENSELANILSRKNIKTGGIFLKNYIPNKPYLKKLKLFQNNNQPIFIKYSSGVRFDWNKSNKKLNIFASKKKSWAVIENSVLTDLDIVFHGIEKKEIDENVLSRFNRFGITGSLNIYKSELDNIKIKVLHSSMEDALNIRNSKGSVSDIKIIASNSDAIDFDFSNLKIKEVDINDAGNDCIDLSYGTYIFKKINLYGCADKGVSVGEKSIAKINQVKLNNFHLGVVSKDSSLVEVKKMEALNLNHNQYGNTPRCGTAYNKKQEFFGGYLKVIEHNCHKKFFYNDKYSNVVVSLK